ncbi:MAG TPA: nitrilase-related carbon-nitrogen hydrolase, partial [Bryobacteraceae bacterium]|nr:nitrilase-related carbon-nitrogen hydrolase [Bryobacteraceae bacterium]
MRNLRVASVQFECKPGDKTANLATIRRFAKEAARAGAEILVTPECSITGYWFLRNLGREEFAALAEPVFDGPSSQALMAMSKEYGMTIGAGLIERGDDGK